MTSLLDRIRAVDLDRGPTGALTSAEAALIAIAVAVGTIGWAALGLATADSLDRPRLLAVLAVAAVTAGVVLWRFPPPRIVVDRGDLVVVGVAVVAAVFFLPGSEYLFADKDPGAYSTHAFAIAREGSTSIGDPILARLPEMFGGPTAYGGRFPGYWYAPDDAPASLPQFFHMYPSLLAALKLLFGSGAVLQTGPLLGIASVASFTAVTRRVFGTAVAAVAGVLLATNMVEVFFAKYPSTETLAQLLYGAAALAAVTALRTGWAPAMGAAGLAASLSFLNRPDGVLMVLVAVGGLALGIAARIERRLLVAGAVGLAAPAGWVWWQAYERNSRYAEANSVPPWPLVAGLVVVVVAAGFALRRFPPRWLPRPRSDRHWQFVGLATLAAVGAWIAFGLLRSRLLGAHIQRQPGRDPLATLDEINLRRLFWFFSPAGLVLFWIGVAVVVVAHRRIATWVLVAPGLALVPVYVWQARISPRLMWWARRFVPAIIPVVIIVIAAAVVWLAVRRGRGQRWLRAAAAAALTITLGVQLHQSIPLVGFREFSGSASLLDQVDSLAVDEAVFLWEAPTDINSPSRNAAGPLWFVHDRPSAVLPADVDQGVIDSVADAFDDHRVIVLTHAAALGDGIDPLRFTSLGRVGAVVDQWAEGTHRPDHANQLDLAMYAWELDASG